MHKLLHPISVFEDVITYLTLANSLAPGRFEWNFKFMLVINGWHISCEIALRWMSMQWLGAIRQQAITRANVDPDICHHMASAASLAHNELIISSNHHLSQGMDE